MYTHDKEKKKSISENRKITQKEVKSYKYVLQYVECQLVKRKLLLLGENNPKYTYSRVYRRLWK